MPSLRLLSVNARTESLDHEALARRISAASADVVCVHGAPSLLRWRSISAALARRSGLVVVGGGRTGGGNLLLCDLGIDSTATRDVVFAGHRGPRPPGATVAALARLGSPFVLVGARLSGDGAAQRAQVEQVRRVVREADPAEPPAVVCVEGAGPGAAVDLQDGQTATAPGVFVDARITVGQIADGVVELTLPEPSD
ncbi:hypothetical protein [uncultured Jatrophihabitans sp.]|uniref:hypothetical protein n=1 Tax=uncultured Jatrophihabitans sp. TaxID=1610747 RepID=UPI0035C98977